MQATPFKISHKPSLGAEDYANSDTHSIRSGRSLGSAASTTVRHPEIHEPGLNSSVVETISAWFSNGTMTRAVQIGEVALVYNATESDATTETIRFDHFSSLEKVAPNPVFIDPVPNQTGSYTVNLSHIPKTTVAFKYQVHLDQSTAASHAPIVIKPAWKIEPTQTSVLVSYSLNPAVLSKLPESTTSLTLHNVVLVVHLDLGTAKILRAQAAGGGLYARDRNVVYWKLNELSLQKDAPAQVLRARFYTEGEAKPGNVEARWEINGDSTTLLGSGIGISRIESGQEKESDPFADADESAAATPTVSWTEVNAVRRLRSGTYVAS
jgi:hypothetical protein